MINSISKGLVHSCGFTVLSFITLQKDTKTPVKGLPRPSTDHDIWSRDHLTPSWVLLPNDQPVLAIIQPGESALDMLETICKVTPRNQRSLQCTKHSSFSSDARFSHSQSRFSLCGIESQFEGHWCSKLRCYVPQSAPQRVFKVSSMCPPCIKQFIRFPLAARRYELSDMSVWAFQRVIPVHLAH